MSRRYQHAAYGAGSDVLLMAIGVLQRPSPAVLLLTKPRSATAHVCTGRMFRKVNVARPAARRFIG